MGIIYRNGIPYAGTGKVARFFAATGDGAIDGSSATLKSIAEKAGDIYICQTAGTLYGISFKVGDAIIFKNAVIAGTTPTSSDFAVNKGTDSDTTYSAGTGLSLSGTTLNHSNSVTAGTASGDNSKTLSFGGTFTIPSVTYDSQGHITSSGTTTMTMPGNPNSDTKVTNTLSTTTKAYVTGTSSSTTNTGTQFFDTGVYLTSTAGELAATTFSGKLKGTIDSSTTATTQTQGNNSTKIATTAYVDTAISDLPSPMVFKGSLGTNGTITALPVDGTAIVGDTYKVITAGTYASQAAKVGDMFICDSKTSSANTWTYIPSADEPSGTVTSVKIEGVAPIVVGNTTPITTSGTRQINHATSGATPGSYGDSAAQTPSYGGTFKVPYVTVNDTGHVTEISEHTVTIPASDNIDTIPSAYCKTAANLQYKFASCTDYSLLDNSYVQVVLKNANTYSGQLYFAIEKDGLINYKKIYINGTVSSSTNYTLPAGTYLVYCDGTNYYFRTDGKITGTGLVDTSNNEIYTNNTGTVTGTGTSNKLAKWNGTNSITSGPGITDNSSSTAVTSTDTNLITGRTLYYAGYTKNTGTVTGSSLTADNIITGNGSTAIKSSGKTIATSITNVDTTVPTSKAVKTYVDTNNTLTAICSTAAATAQKEITSVGSYTDFGDIPEGTTIHVMFQNGHHPLGDNSWTLKIGNSAAKNIFPLTYVTAGCVLSLTKTRDSENGNLAWYINGDYAADEIRINSIGSDSNVNYPITLSSTQSGDGKLGAVSNLYYNPSNGNLAFPHDLPQTTGTTVGIVVSGSKYGLVKSGSSIRYKTNVNYKINKNNIHNNLMNLSPCTFEYKLSPGKTNLGFIAEDVEQINPELCVYENEEEGIVDSYKEKDIITMLVIEAQEKDKIIQSLQSEIELLKQRLDNLES